MRVIAGIFGVEVVLGWGGVMVTLARLDRFHLVLGEMRLGLTWLPWRWRRADEPVREAMVTGRFGQLGPVWVELRRTRASAMVYELTRLIDRATEEREAWRWRAKQEGEE